VADTLSGTRNDDYACHRVIPPRCPTGGR
jgi:hypothetical protein